MKLSKLMVMVFMSGLLIILTACGTDTTSGQTENTEAENGEEIKVLTTIAQIGEPLSVIGGDRVNVESLMGPGVDPHSRQAKVKTNNRKDVY